MVRRVVRPFLARTLLLLLSSGVCLLGLEMVLRAWPMLLGDVFANGVLSKYHTRSGGIYYRDRRLRMHFMIPNLKTQMYYNRYVWTHESDAYGLRNRETSIPADIVLLGDSYIYGHGVDFEATVGHFLGQLTGLSVANLARQGDSAFQEAYLLTEYVAVFRPRFVFYVFSENDIPDLGAFLTREQMQAFVDMPLEAVRYPPRVELKQALSERDEQLRSRSLIRRIRESSYVFKAARWLKWRLGVGPALAAPPSDEAADRESTLAWRYTKKAIAYMQYVATKHGAQLVIAPITPFSTHDHKRLREIAAEYGLPFLDTSALTSADASLWLPRDGHLSPEGARRFAEILAAYARRQK